MAAEGHAPTASEYIVHHLQHWQVNWGLEPVTQKAIVDFNVINLDSVLYALVIGVIGCFVLWLAARKATSGVPGPSTCSKTSSAALYAGSALPGCPVFL